jgi:hypothetical protein
MIYPGRQGGATSELIFRSGLWHSNCLIGSGPLCGEKLCGENVKADESILSGVWFQPHPSVLAFSICPHHRIIPHIPSLRPRVRLAQGPRGCSRSPRDPPTAAYPGGPDSGSGGGRGAASARRCGFHCGCAGFPALRRQDDGSPVACVRARSRARLESGSFHRHERREPDACWPPARTSVTTVTRSAGRNR